MKQRIRDVVGNDRVQLAGAEIGRGMPRTTDRRTEPVATGTYS